MAAFDHLYVQALEFRCDDLEEFADKMISRIHSLQHSAETPWFECVLDLCVEAGELGI